MPMDDTDRKLLKGGAWFCVLGLLFYYAPYVGYQEWRTKEEDDRKTLKETALKYQQYYPPMHQNFLGSATEDSLPATELPAIAEIESDYAQANEQYKKQISATEDSSRMKFPAWTEIPDSFAAEPGIYFQDTWEHHRNILANEWNKAKVECLDPEVGFNKFKGILNTIDQNKAKELLRELYIAEKIINLCIDAKVKQEEYEKGRNFQPEAFMRIVSVTPEESNTAGPSALIPNPRYSPDEKIVTSERFRKYNVKTWKNFIQEYPVHIVLQCDINSYMRFLHRVRKKDQFLVIRTLEIVSPFLKDSKVDVSELLRYVPNAMDSGESLDADHPNKPKGPILDDKHILVDMSASGMDFFDPDVLPFGIYSKREIKRAPTKRKYQIIQGT